MYLLVGPFAHEKKSRLLSDEATETASPSGEAWVQMNADGRYPRSSAFIRGLLSFQTLYLYILCQHGYYIVNSADEKHTSLIIF
jgi:hypothetical protein